MNTAMTLHRKKYQNAILYLCCRLGGEVRGKKKLAKLLYFADFDFYEKYNKSITGDVYKALPMGPFPAALEEITKELAEENQLVVEQSGGIGGYNKTEVYRALSEPDEDTLDEDEKKMLDRVALRYGNLNGKQLEELSHAEAPYVGTEPQHQIPYELTFYRGTDFADL